MNKFQNILMAMISIEADLLQKVPILSTGKAGNILQIALVSEEAALGVIGAIQAQKAASAPATPASVAPTV